MQESLLAERHVQPPGLIHLANGHIYRSLGMRPTGASPGSGLQESLLAESHNQPHCMTFNMAFSQLTRFDLEFQGKLTFVRIPRLR